MCGFYWATLYINKALCKIFNVHTSDCIVSLQNFSIFRSLRLILKSEEVNLYTDYYQLKSLLYYLKYKPWTGCINLCMLYVCVCFYRAMHFSAKHGLAIACRLSVSLSVRL